MLGRWGTAASCIKPRKCWSDSPSRDSATPIQTPTLCAFQADCAKPQAAHCCRTHYHRPNNLLVRNSSWQPATCNRQSILTHHGLAISPSQVRLTPVALPSLPPQRPSLLNHFRHFGARLPSPRPRPRFDRHHFGGSPRDNRNSQTGQVVPVSCLLHSPRSALNIALAGGPFAPQQPQ